MAKGRFSSSGVVVGSTSRSKWGQKLQHQKGSKVTMGFGLPRQSEGAVGDITVREIPSEGNRAYIKTNSGWVDINTMQSADKTKWTDMILVNSWATDATYGTPQYFRDTDGFVHLRGGVDSGTSYNADITILPVGFRPAKDIYRLITLDGLMTNVALQTIRIQDSGEIDVVAQRDFDLSSSLSIVWNVAAAESEVSADTTVGASLEGITFFAGQKIRGSGGGSSSGGGGGGLP